MDVEQIKAYFRMGLDSLLEEEEYKISCKKSDDSFLKQHNCPLNAEYIVVVESKGVLNFQKNIEDFFHFNTFSHSDDLLFIGYGESVSKKSRTSVFSKSQTTAKADKKPTIPTKKHTLKYLHDRHVSLPAYLDKFIYSEIGGGVQA